MPTHPAERAIHQTILRVFAGTGAPPTTDELDRVAASFHTSVAELTARLHDADVIRLGPDKQIRAAYPFSAIPTRHRVRLANGPDVYAMCVIDALGMSAMLNTDAVITTSDPITGHAIIATIAEDQSI